MKVLFLQDVPGTAYAGDIKEVKPGFARNYLLPQTIAVLATRDQMNRVEGLRKAASKRRDASQAEWQTLAEKLNGATILIEARAGRNDRLYGAITNTIVAEKISKFAEREIDRRRVVLSPIHQLGEYSVPVKLYPGIEPRVKVLVTSPGQQGAAAPSTPAAEIAAEAPAAGAPTPEVQEEKAAPSPA